MYVGSRWWEFVPREWRAVSFVPGRLKPGGWDVFGVGAGVLFPLSGAEAEWAEVKESRSSVYAGGVELA
jgi:hypothetical protein